MLVCSYLTGILYPKEHKMTEAEKEKARIRAREWRKNNLERSNANAKARRESRTPEQIEKDKQYNKEYRRKNSERLSEQRREYRQANREKIILKDKKYNYGIDAEEYKDLFEQQEYKCGICKKLFSSEFDSDACIDHDHPPSQKQLPGKIRGILCRMCNWALGNIGSIENHRRLIDYKKRYDGV